MDCHIKMGQLEFWVIPLGVCDCDPALGAAHSSAMEPTCVSTHRQLETAAFPQLITKSPCSASSKRNTECNLPLALPAHAGERGQTLQRVPSHYLYFTEWTDLDPGQSHPWAYQHTAGSATASSQQPQIHIGPILFPGIIADLCTWDLALLMLAPNEGGENKLIYASGAISLASLACLLTAFVILIFKQ